MGLVILLIAAGSYSYLGTQVNDNRHAVNTSPTPTLRPTQTSAELRRTTIFTQAPKPSITNDVATYKHSSLRYTLAYPASWVEKPGPKIRDAYEDFYVQSSDYKAFEMLLQKGASFLVRTEDTTEESIADVFKMSLGYQIAKNRTQTAVDGVEAIQYDYSYEGVNATNTEFIKNGKHYVIRFQYVDDRGKEADWSTYVNFLASFKAG